MYFCFSNGVAASWKSEYPVSKSESQVLGTSILMYVIVTMKSKTSPVHTTQINGIKKEKKTNNP